jgi:thiamine-monophosphate kinase
LAAMGAEPLGVTLALALPQPEQDPEWVTQFRAGFVALAEHWRVPVLSARIGRGPLAVAVGAYGVAPAGTALRRSGAAPGDGIYVTGRLGDAGLALERRLAGVPASATNAADQRLDRPQPRLDVAGALRGVASAAIDLSDGLVADLGHVLDASGVGASVNVERLPLSAELRACTDVGRIRRLALTAGDDYELCFTVPARRARRLRQVLAGTKVPVARIGQIETRPGLRLVDSRGRVVGVDRYGYEHFSPTAP